MTEVVNMFDRRRRAYFIVSSKHGASLSVEHPVGRQTLVLPVHPSSAVEDALPFLEPAFAHYAQQWPKIMVSDPDDTDADGFWVDAGLLPPRIADLHHAAELREIAARHAPGLASYWGDYFFALRETDGSPFISDNNDEVCSSVEERGIEPWSQ
jgi:hypothetical protein